MAEGLGNSAIAGKLVVTDGAVHKHIRSIFAKLDLSPRTRSTGGSRRSCATWRTYGDRGNRPSVYGPWYSRLYGGPARALDRSPRAVFLGW